MTWTRALAALALPTWVACSHSHPRVRSEEPVSSPVAAAPSALGPKGTPPAAVEAQACRRDDDCRTGQLCVTSVCRPIVPGIAECDAATSAHFDFDRWDVQERDVPMLRRAARCFVAGSMQALIAGNCDERGTAQYNVALGYRRAAAIQRYLEALGVPSARLQTVSYGEELPLCRESSEECWAKNRRADLSPGTGQR